MVKQRFFSLVGVLIIVGAFLWLDRWRERAWTLDSINYQGQSIKLSKHYRDYESYQNDTDKIAGEDVDKVQQLVKSAPIAKEFPGREPLIQAVFDLKFPGYGLGSYGEKPQSDGSVFSLFGIEVPESGTTRYLLFRGNQGTFTLVDDFIHDSEAGIAGVSLREGQFVYATLQGAKVLARTPSIR